VVKLGNIYPRPLLFECANHVLRRQGKESTRRTCQFADHHRLLESADLSATKQAVYPKVT
jgi:hypothetical protein